MHKIRTGHLDGNNSGIRLKTALFIVAWIHINPRNIVDYLFDIKSYNLLIKTSI